MEHDARIIYLDNAATTFPKPREVLSEMLEAYGRMGVSPGRGSYDLATQAADTVYQVRKQVCEFFGGDDPERVIFGYNATDALNTIIQGLVTPGCHVVSSRLEHNSVLRPLNELRTQRIVNYNLVPFDSQGFIDPQDVATAIRADTKFVILPHASNVLGTLQPVKEIGLICRDRGIPLILDVTQSAGIIPINMESLGVDAVAFTGHKALMGPTGIGGLVLRRGLEVRPPRFGGTGVDSSTLLQTDTYPHRLEAGTINLLGIIGLSAGIRFVVQQGMVATHRHEMALLKRLRDGLAALEPVKIYCADNLDNHVPVLLATMEGMDAQDFGDILDGDFHIAVRSGLHCAPLVHLHLGTSPSGGVRFSPGRFTTPQDIDVVIDAILTISSTR